MFVSTHGDDRTHLNFIFNKKRKARVGVGVGVGGTLDSTILWGASTRVESLNGAHRLGQLLNSLSIFGR